jgi:hypothetical protein
MGLAFGGFSTGGALLTGAISRTPSLGMVSMTVARFASS